ncbi:MAG TPA: flagellin, partial [bacterium]|nr:flagellin [bacterium]
LLDGTSGISGGTQGEGLTYIGASVATRTAPVAGYQVEVTRAPTRAQLVGTTPLTNENVKNLTVTLYEGGKSAQVTAAPDDSAESFLGKVKSAVQEAGLAVTVDQDKDGYITITHMDYGSAASFQASSSMAGIISQQANVLEAPNHGQDIAGTIAGEKAVGRGQVLTGVAGNDKTDGLSVAYIGAQTSGGGQGEQPQRRPQTGIVGTVNVVNNSLDFQVGPNVGQRVSVALPTVTPGTLARRVQTASGFHSLADIDVTTPQGARDTVRMVDTAIDEITLSRGQLGAFQRDGLESNINTLRVTAENLTAAESTIRDTDVANELAEYTKQRILLESNSALLAQANQLPNTVVHLIG